MVKSLIIIPNTIGFDLWCSMIGAVTVAIGFYAVMWGLVQEEKKVHEKRNQICGSVSSSAAPLLQNKSIDV